MKKLIILSIFTFLLCFIRIDNKSYLKQIDLYEANEFLNKKQNNYPKPVTNFDLSKQNNNYQEADFLKYDNNYIYFLNNNVLNIFDMNNNYLIKSLSFNDFYCYQLLINDNDIIYVNTNRHTLEIFTTTNSFLCMNYSLSQLIKESDILIQCHKSYAINPKFITNLDKTTYTVTLQFNDKVFSIPIGRKYKETLLRKMD